MPTLNVLYFAHVRARVGLPRETLDLPAATVSEAVAALVARHPALGPLLPRCRVALNGTFVAPEAPVADGDELVLIPPVAGGSDGAVGPGGTRSFGAVGLPRLHIGPEPLDDVRIAALRAAVSSPATGAAVLFVGTVRDHARGRAVLALSYEAYLPMALSELARVVRGVEAEWPSVRVAVHHRTGDLVPTDTAVVVAVGSPHRAEAFAACAAVIDRLKQDVPIWKHERGPDGAEWIDDRP
jgi:molybdopterin converting factor subunit 1